LRAPKSSLLAMVLIPLARGSSVITPNPALGSAGGRENVGRLLARAVCPRQRGMPA